MNQTDQRKAIATICGVESIEIGTTWWGWSFAGIEYPGDMPSYFKLPNYLEEREAMHQALKRLDDDEWLEFMLYLCDILQIQPGSGKWAIARAFLENPTVPQLAEAFLKAKGVWVPE